MKILVIADVHGNAEALNTVLKSKIDYEEIFHIGDIVDWGPDPLECITKLKDCIHVKGNHDEAVGCNIIPHPAVSGHYKEFALKTLEVSRTLLDGRGMKWLRSLALTQKIVRDGKTFYLVHGTPRSPLYEYFNPETAEMQIWKTIEAVEADFVIMGHTHKPFVKRLGNKTVLNPGSVGQPRDGDWRTSFALIDTEDNSVQITRLEYDVESVCRNLARKGFPYFVQYTIRTGKMPRIDRDGNVLEGSLLIDGMRVES